VTGMRGRRPDPLLPQAQRLIASLVYQAVHEGEQPSEREAQRVVASYLGTSVSTVRRACVAMRGSPRWGGALMEELRLDVDPGQTSRQIAALRRWLAQSRRRRGK
jgi:hypothetical protein